MGTSIDDLQIPNTISRFTPEIRWHRTDIWFAEVWIDRRVHIQKNWRGITGWIQNNHWVVSQDGWWHLNDDMLCFLYASKIVAGDVVGERSCINSHIFIFDTGSQALKKQEHEKKDIKLCSLFLNCVNAFINLALSNINHSVGITIETYVKTMVYWAAQ